MFSVFRRIKMFAIKKMIAVDSTIPCPLVLLHNNQFFLRTFSSIVSLKSNQDSYTVSYLINSCGLSPEMATSAAEKVKFQTPEKPDKVLNLLRTHGFTKTQISMLVRKLPELLLAKPEKTLLPKLEFFQSIGVPATDLARLLSVYPTLLTRSLENRIIPTCNFLKSVLQSDKKVVTSLKRTLWNFGDDHTKYLAPNIAVLREYEVPESSIALLMTHFPVVTLQKHEQLREKVIKVKDMGFDPLKSAFVLAVYTISGSNKAVWDRCYETYRKWDWSEDEILSAFRKHPLCMCMSEKKITRGMDYFVNKMGWHSKDISRHPMVLCFSLEKRIIPRCLVIQVLSLKGLVKKDLTLYTILNAGEKHFLERFVTKYEEQVPQLLCVYQGKMDILEL